MNNLNSKILCCPRLTHYKSVDYIIAFLLRWSFILPYKTDSNLHQNVKQIVKRAGTGTETAWIRLQSTLFQRLPSLHDLKENSMLLEACFFHSA